MKKIFYGISLAFLVLSCNTGNVQETNDPCKLIAGNIDVASQQIGFQVN